MHRHVGSQRGFRGPEIFGVDAEEAGERDLTPRTSSNCLRYLEITPSKRSLTSSSFIKPPIVGGVADIDQFVSVPKFLPGLLLCNSVSLSLCFSLVSYTIRVHLLV